MRLFLLCLLMTALLAGCTTSTSAVAPPSSSTASSELPLDIRWVRRSAEHQAAYAQTYRAASAYLSAMADTISTDRWAVVLDADETLIDNSLYQQERAEQGLGFSPESWNAWTLREEATALPGAVAFTRQVAELGGRVVVVTNRDDAVCEATRRNLQAVAIEASAILCQTDTGDKNPRFALVEQGYGDLPPLRIVMWVGDNIQDFPGLSQQVRFGGQAALSEFGGRFWLLPNPMYGSWTRNAE